MMSIKNRIFSLVAAAAIALSFAISAPAHSADDQTYLTKKVRKELVTLPYYGIFDNLAFEIQGDTVVLSGQVVRASTRKDAERRIAKIEGVENVINKIEVLPPSSFDDRIRLRTYRAVFSKGSLYRYAQGANPLIHIVVNRGKVTLEGIVANETDKNLAFIAANGVPEVFSVTNNLRVKDQN